MDNRIDHRNGTLGDIATLVLQYPGLRAKAGLGLVTDVLGPTDWITGPGDDVAAIMQPATDQETSSDPAPLPGGQPTRPQALPALTVTELVRAIRDGSLSPAGLVTEALTSRHRWPPVTTAASQIWPEELWRPRGRGQPTRTCHWRESRCW